MIGAPASVEFLQVVNLGKRVLVNLLFNFYPCSFRGIKHTISNECAHPSSSPPSSVEDLVLTLLPDYSSSFESRRDVFSWEKTHCLQFTSVHGLGSLASYIWNCWWSWLHANNHTFCALEHSQKRWREVSVLRRTPRLRRQGLSARGLNLILHEMWQSPCANETAQIKPASSGTCTRAHGCVFPIKWGLTPVVLIVNAPWARH